MASSAKRTFVPLDGDELRAWAANLADPHSSPNPDPSPNESDCSCPFFCSLNKMSRDLSPRRRLAVSPNLEVSKLCGQLENKVTELRAGKLRANQIIEALSTSDQLLEQCSIIRAMTKEEQQQLTSGIVSLLNQLYALPTVLSFRESTSEEERETVLNEAERVCRGCLALPELHASIASDASLFTAWFGSELVAFAILTDSLKTPHGHLEYLCATPGAGGAMLDYVVDQARERGMERIDLEALDYNVNFYRRKGFQLGPWCKELPRVQAALDPYLFTPFECSEQLVPSDTFVNYKRALRSVWGGGLKMSRCLK